MNIYQHKYSPLIS